MSDRKPDDKKKPYAFLEIVFTMMAVFPGFLFLTSPPQAPAQVVFRAALLVVGVVGLVIIHILRIEPR